MRKLAPGFFATIVGLTVMSFSGGAAAQSTWALGSTCNPSPAQGAYTVGGNTVSCATGVPAETITMTAYSNATATGTGNYIRGSIGDFNSSGVGVYSGSGETGTNSQHAMDNVTTSCGGGTGTVGTTGCGGSQEFMLVNFGPYKVNLNSISVGYRDTDADVAILRWDGADKTASEMASMIGGASSLASIAGWTLVGTESLDSTPDTSLVNLGNKVSSWWIVSTYYGTAAGQTAGHLDTGNDRFKLSALTGTVCTSGNYSGGNQGNGGTCGPAITVPEPGMLATLGLALFGATVARRRAQRKA
jgi:hypothetical protein